MPKNVRYEPRFMAGAEFDVKMVVPLLAADPVGLSDAWVWYNTVDNKLKARINGVTVELGAALDGETIRDLAGNMFTDSTSIDFTFDDAAETITAIVKTEAIQDIVGTMVVDNTTIDWLYDDTANTLSAAVLNSPQFDGRTFAQAQTEIIAAIVDSAPGLLDTLNELAAAIGDDPNFATTMTALINARSRPFAAALAGGAATEVVTHNFATRDVVGSVYVASGSYEEEGYILRHTGTNTVTVVSEAGNIPAGRRIVLHAVGT